MTIQFIVSTDLEQETYDAFAKFLSKGTGVIVTDPFVIIQEYFKGIIMSKVADFQKLQAQNAIQAGIDAALKDAQSKITVTTK